MKWTKWIYLCPLIFLGVVPHAASAVPIITIIGGDLNLNEENVRNIVIDYLPVAGRVVLCEFAVHQTTPGTPDGCSQQDGTKDFSTGSISDIVVYDGSHSVSIISDTAGEPPAKDNPADSGFGFLTSADCGFANASKTCQYLSEIGGESLDGITCYPGPCPPMTFIPIPIGLVGSDTAEPVCIDPTNTNETCTIYRQRFLIKSDTTVPTPEPSNLSLFGSGIAGLFALAIRRRRKRTNLSPPPAL